VDVRDLGALRRLHPRPRDPRLARHRSAWLSIIGFVAVLFNFTIVNMFFRASSYSGLT
jgi:hypothetical protein